MSHHIDQGDSVMPFDVINKSLGVDVSSHVSGANIVHGHTRILEAFVQRGDIDSMHALKMAHGVIATRLDYHDHSLVVA